MGLDRTGEMLANGAKQGKEPCHVVSANTVTVSG